MDNVKRYGHIGYLVNASERMLELYPDMKVYVKAADFDRVTAERDAALGELKTQTLRADAAVGDANEAEQRLTAADERVDVLETALAGMLFAFDDGVGREWSEDLLDFARKLTTAKEFKAALKPAEGGGDAVVGVSLSDKALSLIDEEIRSKGLPS